MMDLDKLYVEWNNMYSFADFLQQAARVSTAQSERLSFFDWVALSFN